MLIGKTSFDLAFRVFTNNPITSLEEHSLIISIIV